MPQAPSCWRNLPTATPLVVSRQLAVRASKQQHAAAKPLALGACVAAAVLGALGPPGLPALAAATSSTPDYGPWSFYNMTQYQVDLFLVYDDDGTCWAGDDGTTNPGFKFTSPTDRGSCKINRVVATAFKTYTPGGKPKVVDEVIWVPTDPDSQKYSEWVVLQVQNENPSIQVVHIID